MKMIVGHQSYKSEFYKLLGVNYLELLLETNSSSALAMKNAHKTMLEIFQDLICLEKYYGPVQMGVFGLEYSYLPKKYTICIESERGIITIMVKNDENKFFYPSMIYSEANYYHYADNKEDVFQLINLTYKSIIKKEIIFLSSEEFIKHNEQRKFET